MEASASPCHDQRRGKAISPASRSVRSSRFHGAGTYLRGTVAGIPAAPVVLPHAWSSGRCPRMARAVEVPDVLRGPRPPSSRSFPRTPARSRGLRAGLGASGPVLGPSGARRAARKERNPPWLIQRAPPAGPRGGRGSASRIGRGAVQKAPVPSCSGPLAMPWRGDLVSVQVRPGTSPR